MTAVREFSRAYVERNLTMAEERMRMYQAVKMRHGALTPQAEQMLVRTERDVAFWRRIQSELGATCHNRDA